MSDFIHLRVHSAYSLSEGAIQVKDLISKAKDMKMPAVAITDTGNLFGAMEFAITAQAEGIQPIIACQVQISPPDESNVKETDTLVFLVQSAEGYANLLKIVSYTFLKGIKNGIVSL